MRAPRSTCDGVSHVARGCVQARGVLLCPCCNDSSATLAKLPRTTRERAVSSVERSCRAPALPSRLSTLSRERHWTPSEKRKQRARGCRTLPRPHQLSPPPLPPHIHLSPQDTWCALAHHFKPSHDATDARLRRPVPTRSGSPRRTLARCSSSSSASSSAGCAFFLPTSHCNPADLDSGPRATPQGIHLLHFLVFSSGRTYRRVLLFAVTEAVAVGLWNQLRAVARNGTELDGSKGLVRCDSRLTSSSPPLPGS